MTLPTGIVLAGMFVFTFLIGALVGIIFATKEALEFIAELEEDKE